MPYTCTLPDMDTTVEFQDAEGKHLTSVDVAELETIIIQCRIEDPHFNPKNPLSMNAWFARSRLALSQRIGKQISLAVACLLIRKVMDTMKLLKKTMLFEQLWTLPPNMESTDSSTSTTASEDSVNLPNSECFTQTSPANTQSASLPSDMPMPG